MSLSLTWQELPPSLLAPLMDQAISAVEAAELFDLSLMEPGQFFKVPVRLHPAMQRLLLWQMEPGSPLRH